MFVLFLLCGCVSFACSSVVFPLHTVAPVRTFGCSATPPSACVGRGARPSRTAAVGDVDPLPPSASRPVSGTRHRVRCCLVACVGRAIVGFGGRS